MEPLALVPKPVWLEAGEGHFQLGAEACVLAAGAGRQVGEYLASLLGLTATQEAANAVIGLDLVDDPGRFGAEGYCLAVDDSGIGLQAATPAGLFYAGQTLRQLLPAAAEQGGPPAGGWAVPQVRVEDRPRYAWRGMHLDVGRHFFPVEFIERYIDLLALHKFNRFHWHLTEDQGWRLESRRYPELTRVGAWRRGSDGALYGGFYTRDEIRRVVAYARARQVEIVPEIEMPGHAQAAVAAYPELSCSGGPFEVWTEWGISPEVYCAGNDATIAFLQGIMEEVLELFPGDFVHVGGDECPKQRWQACRKCQGRIAAEGLAGEEGLQSWVIGHFDRFLSERGRRLIGWDEILEGGLASRAAVMSWRGEEGGIAAARAGHDVVMSPHSHCYFDYKHVDAPDEPGRLGVISLERVYQFEPTPTELDAGQAGHILGAQGNVWSEGMPDGRAVEHMALPRMCALAEVVWSPGAGRSWDDFVGRLRGHGARLEALEVPYYRDRSVWN